MKRIFLTILTIIFFSNLNAQHHVGISFGGESLVGLPSYGYQHNFYDYDTHSQGYINFSVDVFLFFAAAYSIKVAPGFDYKNGSIEGSLAFTNLILERDNSYRHLTFTPKVGFNTEHFKTMAGPTFYLWRKNYDEDSGVQNFIKFGDVPFSFEIYGYLKEIQEEKESE